MSIGWDVYIGQTMERTKCITISLKGIHMHFTGTSNWINEKVFESKRAPASANNNDNPKLAYFDNHKLSQLASIESGLVWIWKFAHENYNYVV